MKLQLTITDRIKLINLLPKQGAFTQMIHADAIGRMIEIGSDEAEKIELKTEESEGVSVVKWNPEKEELKSIKFNDSQLEVIKGIFESLEKSNEEVDIGLINLYNKLK